MALAGVLTGLTVYRIIYQTGKIYLTVLIAAPPLFFIGLYQLWKSLRTNVCSQCKQELRFGTATLSLNVSDSIDTPSLTKHIEAGRVAKQPNPPYLKVEFEFCPACVSIGTLRSSFVSVNGSSKVLPEQELQGPIVRIIKDKLLL